MPQFIRKQFINREYSWLKFNERVLLEAQDPLNPLIEKGKFLAIAANNLDEFCSVRIGSLFNELFYNSKATENKTGMTPKQQLTAIYAQLRKFYTLKEKVAKTLFAEFKKEGIEFQDIRKKNAKAAKRFEKYFSKTMLPLLNPLVLDNKNPMIHFDHLKALVVVYLERNNKNYFGVLPVPEKCDRLIKDTTQASRTKIITREDLAYYFADKVFDRYQVLEKCLVRVTRNADFDHEVYSIDNESEYDFSALLKDKVEDRVNLAPVRLEVTSQEENIVTFLCKKLDIALSQVLTVKSHFDYKFLFNADEFISYNALPRLKYPPFIPRKVYLPNPNSVMDSIKQQDIFLSYPYESMNTLLDLLDEASMDSRVTDIKITLYRVDKQSRVIEALRKAVRNGKSVKVLVELTARFDEAHNLFVASILREEGCSVSYGFGNYKVHSKVCLIVLKEGENISYLTHLGTGNYNESTAKQYTDVNVITANQEIGEDASDFFRNLSLGTMEDFEYKKLLIAPVSFKEGLLKKVREQIALAEEGKEARIVAKMNSLTDLGFIKEFIRASNAGVKIDLIVRGICCIIPGLIGKTENITVKSIIGRFLEHSRIYAFGTENPEIYISSADLMTRNVTRRVEIATPILCSNAKKRVMHLLEVQLADKEKAWYLESDGIYRKRNNEGGKSSQQVCMDWEKAD